MDYKFTNDFFELIITGAITFKVKHNCEKNIEQAIAIPDDYINDLELYREAFNMSCMLDHPVYDMLYLILARRNNALLLTMNKKLSTAAQKCNIKT